MLKGNNTVVDISYLTTEQKQSIKDFLQGAVYTWCNVNNNKPFRFKDLMGGDNYYWQNTPLYTLYDYYLNQSKDDDTAVSEAGKDAGMLLKSVLINDQNKTFNQAKVIEFNLEKNKYMLI